MRFGIDKGANRQDCISEYKLLLLADFSSLSCTLCLKSLMEFVDVIRANKLEGSVFGVMIMEEKKEEAEAEKYRKIARKRLKGFINGSNISFPFFLDEEGVFRPLNQNASATLIVMNGLNGTVEKYEFPLSGSQLSAIIQ